MVVSWEIGVPLREAPGQVHQGRLFSFRQRPGADPTKRYKKGDDLVRSWRQFPPLQVDMWHDDQRPSQIVTPKSSIFSGTFHDINQPASLGTPMTPWKPPYVPRLRVGFHAQTGGSSSIPIELIEPGFSSWDGFHITSPVDGCEILHHQFGMVEPGEPQKIME